ncbi:MAG: hypothetical protein WD226_05125 [Planctomycetota bacterium]
MKRFLLVPLAAVAIYFAGRSLVMLFVSDETKIRWIVEEMQESFNDARAGGCLSPVADTWRHEDSAWLDRETLHGALVRTFFTERDRDKRFLLRVEVPEDNLVIVVTDDTADVRAAVKFLRREGEAWAVTWYFELEAEFRDGDDGWQIHRTSHRNVEGKGF